MESLENKKQDYFAFALGENVIIDNTERAIVVALSEHNPNLVGISYLNKRNEYNYNPINSDLTTVFINTNAHTWVEIERAKIIA